ncbi:NAD-dependent epimerase/dehydratase family protein [Dyella acidiphila]|uniref:NAD-dependent epimerase/dehydratase family protein n=1 Tax=Dyella acidiphila TaxID=2775866 RepID=UPI003082D00C
MSTYYLIGGGGRLGQAIASQYANQEIISLQRSVYADWSGANAVDRIARYFSPHAADATVFVASGLLDPRLATDELVSVNYRLPRNVIDGAARLGIKVVTFGTIMESLLDVGNAYVESKKRLREYVEEALSAAWPVLHLQIHTLYGGGQPSPFMFLGQMLTAIRNNEPFRMTSGRQLREYHHFEDEARAVRLIAGMPEMVGVTNLSHGKPVSLRALAEAVFGALEKNHLLRVGALPEPSEENYGKTFAPTMMLDTIEFRDAIQGVVEYMCACCTSGAVAAGKIGS